MASSMNPNLFPQCAILELPCHPDYRSSNGTLGFVCCLTAVVIEIQFGYIHTVFPHHNND
jgi:hypothetical protein